MVARKGKMDTDARTFVIKLIKNEKQAWHGNVVNVSNKRRTNINNEEELHEYISSSLAQPESK